MKDIFWVFEFTSFHVRAKILKTFVGMNLYVTDGRNVKKSQMTETTY